MTLTASLHSHPAFSLARFASAAAISTLALALPAQAQVTLKQDGQWRHLLTAGLNINDGNTRSSALNLNTDSVRATLVDKWSATAQVLYARSAGVTTGERALVSTQYNGDLSPRTFAFVQASGLTDRPANISNRLAATTGLGWHLMKRDDEFWDVWAGVGVSQEKYVQPADIRGGLRDSYTDAGLVLAQESSLRLTPNTAFKQKLVWLPSLRESGHSRIEFDTQVAVAINDSLNLSTGLSMRYNSHPAPGLERLDTALTTGLSLRYD
jgi:putative salt-induced outer membrane protein